MPAVLSKNNISVPRFNVKSLQALFFGSSLTSALFILHLYLKSKRKGDSRNEKSSLSHADSPSKKRRIDGEFYTKLSRILKVLIPSWICPETGLLGLISSMLVIRSLCDVWTIYLGTLLESAIITHDNRKFNRHLLEFAMTMPLMSLVNSLLKYTTENLSLRFRFRLTTHLLSKYMRNNTFYKTVDKLPNIDQLISTDVDRFSSTLSTLYSQLAKPTLDIFIYVYGISTSVGKGVPGYMIGYLGLAAAILMRIRKPMGKLTAREQELEGEFRFVNSRVQTNAEEVAFYGGSKWELGGLLKNFGKLINHLESYTEFKFVMNFLENIVAKYIATVVGYYSVSRPFLTKNNVLNDMTHQERLEAYYKSGRMLINLAQAIGRLVMNGKELSKLSGYTHRVDELISTLDKLNKEQEEMLKLNKSSNFHTANGFSSSFKNIENVNLNDKKKKGVYLYEDKVIRFENVPIVTPNGDVLIKELNLEVKSGTNVLICGPNGCGKSSLFRILGELWPLQGGVLTKPKKEELFYVPQRPYMPIGTLRDQIIYPDTVEDMKRKGINDDDLLLILSRVDLDWLASSKSCSEEEMLLVGQRRSFDEVDNWMDVLSGGQKQRVAMSRLIYHKPQFAILDECTSAVSVDVEGAIYNYCSQVGITLFTVSHRKSLWKFHEYYLHMDGRGNYKFEKIDEKVGEEYGT